VLPARTPFGEPADPAPVLPSGAELEVPGGTRVSCRLMDDVVDSSLATMAPGYIQYEAAPFSNPFRNGQEEAVVIDDQHRLTHLHRAATDVGWRQDLVLDAAGQPISATGVVVVVHPRDLSVWLISVQNGNADRPINALQLVSEVVDGTPTCRWQQATDWLNYGPGGAGTACSTCRSPMTRTVRASPVWTAPGGTYRLVVIAPLMGSYATAFRLSAYTTGTPSFLEAGARFPILPGALTNGAALQPHAYVVTQKKLHWFDCATGKLLETDTKDVSRLVGTFAAPSTYSVGALTLNSAGNLMVTYPSAAKRDAFESYTVSDVRFADAHSWVDANGMIHVYGIGKKIDRLMVMHQKAWRTGAPVWTTSTGVRPPDPDPVTVTTCVGLATDVAAFTVDPYPDTFPNQLVKYGDFFDTDSRFAFHTQDVNSARWSRDDVQITDGQRHRKLATSYVSTVTVLSRRGTPMPNLPVRITAESLAEVRVDGVSYLVGPGRTASVSTDAQGKVVMSTAADTLAPAVLHVDAAGLQNGAVVQPAATVQSYLGGRGTLPSQRGTFGVEACAMPRPPGSRSCCPVTTARWSASSTARGRRSSWPRAGRRARYGRPRTACPRRSTGSPSGRGRRPGRTSTVCWSRSITSSPLPRSSPRSTGCPRTRRPGRISPAGRATCGRASRTARSPFRMPLST
jgi:hypothetical protein